MDKWKISILFAGGGTAGHILPALATEDALKRRIVDGREIATFYLAVRTGAELSILKERGARFRIVPKTNFPRRLNLQIITFIPRLFIALLRTLSLARGVDIIVGFGGYVALPAYLAARILGKPLIIHEANALPGLANRVGKRFATRALSNFPISGWSERDVIGLPIRESIWQIGTLNSQARAQAQVSARKELGLDGNRKTVLVAGGSLGAERINHVLAQALPELLVRGYQVLHSVGRANQLPVALEGYHPVPYISRMELAYLASDVVLSRSGAGSCAEISALGLPAILVPLSIGNGEQLLNAKRLADTPAVRVITNEELNGKLLLESLHELAQMSIRPNSNEQSSSDRMAQIIIEVLDQQITGRAQS